MRKNHSFVNLQGTNWPVTYKEGEISANLYCYYNVMDHVLFAVSPVSQECEYQEADMKKTGTNFFFNWVMGCYYNNNKKLYTQLHPS